MGTYFGHWLALDEQLQAQGAKLPRIYCVNWFRKNGEGQFIWPGFGENMRVLSWILDRIAGRAKGEETMFGIAAGCDEFNWNGLDFNKQQLEQATALDAQHWREAVHLHDELSNVRTRFERRLAAVLA